MVNDIGYSGLIVNFHRSLFLMSYRIKDPVQCAVYYLLWIVWTALASCQNWSTISSFWLKLTRKLCYALNVNYCVLYKCVHYSTLQSRFLYQNPEPSGPESFARSGPAQWFKQTIIIKKLRKVINNRTWGLALA